MQKGQPKQAAEHYQRLAEQESAYQNQYRMLTIDSFIKAGNPTDAITYANAIDPASLSLQERHHLNLLYAQIYLSDGDAEQAMAKLDIIPEDLLETKDRIIFHQSRAFAYSLNGELLNSVLERIILGELFQDPVQQYDNNAAILETLSILPASSLQLQPTSQTLNGWVSLTKILKQLTPGSSEFNTSINDWRLAFPQHPANSAFLDEYLTKPRHAFKQPSSIAVLLPDSGPYAQAAQAIREGFMAAYYHQQNEDFKPSIQFYDTASSNILALYNQAVVEGAELIIGPLNKDKIEALITATDLSTPVLALNHIAELYQPMLYQFGLSPQDEIEQVAGQAWIDGHQKALLLVPESNRGQRISGYFNSAWQAVDGVILESQTYKPGDSDFSSPIKKLLNLDESRYRYQRLRQMIPKLKFTARRRHDADVIFLNGHPRATRLLNPQLRFYRASRIPIYATPGIYNGRPNPSQDLDLNGIRFCDIPWLYDDAYQGELSLESLQDSWRQFPGIYLRLIALGIDAFNLVPHLDKLDTIQYRGATGNLLLTGSNRIKRHLVCAKFIDGIPQIISTAEESSKAFQH